MKPITWLNRPVKGDNDGLDEDGKQVFWLKSHINQFCHFCMKLIGTQLKRHIKFEHQDIRYSCDKSFHRQGVLERHVKSEHQTINYSCEHCDKASPGLLIDTTWKHRRLPREEKLIKPINLQTL